MELQTNHMFSASGRLFVALRHTFQVGRTDRMPTTHDAPQSRRIMAPCHHWPVDY